jgi:hypothetical protein
MTPASYSYFSSMKLSKEVSAIVKEDCENGLTKEEIQGYLNSKMTVNQIKIYSKAIRTRMKQNSDAVSKLEEEISRRDKEIESLRKKKPDEKRQKEEPGEKTEIMEEEEKVKMAENENIKIVYQIPVQGVSGVDYITMERETPKRETVKTIIRKIMMSFRSNRNLVSKVIDKELKKEQLEQIKIAISKGLKEQQLVKLINSNAEAERMEKIIEIAVLENALSG